MTSISRPLRRHSPCPKAQAPRPNRSVRPIPSATPGFGVKFPEYVETPAQVAHRIGESSKEDDRILTDLPADALQQTTPHTPTMVVNLDQLLGTQDTAAYRRSMSRVLSGVQQQLLQHAEKDGYGPMAFTPSHVHSLRDRDSGRWPIVLASLLVRDPSKASLTNQAILHQVAEEMGVRPFAKSYMSKPLTKRQKHAVMDILEKHGYQSAGRPLKTGTDVRRLVMAHTRQGEESPPVSVRFQLVSRPGSITIADKTYALHPRRGKPKGSLLADLEMNIDKTRVPLGVAMKLLGLKDAQITSLLVQLATEDV